MLHLKFLNNYRYYNLKNSMFSSKVINFVNTADCTICNTTKRARCESPVMLVSLNVHRVMPDLADTARPMTNVGEQTHLFPVQKVGIIFLLGGL